MNRLVIELTYNDVPESLWKENDEELILSWLEDNIHDVLCNPSSIKDKPKVVIWRIVNE